MICKFILGLSLAGLFTGCHFTKWPAPLKTATTLPQPPPKLAAVEAHRDSLLRAGWTVHEFHGAEHWCSPGVKFRPPPEPPSPPAALIGLRARFVESAAAASDGESDAVASEPVIIGPSLDITAGFDTYILVGREVNQPGLGWWLFEPQVHSPNVVVDPGTGGAGYEPQLFIQYWR